MTRMNGRSRQKKFKRKTEKDLEREKTLKRKIMEENEGKTVKRDWKWSTLEKLSLD